MRAGGSWQQPAVLCSAVLRRAATAPVAAGCRVCRRSGAGPSARAGERQTGSPVLCRAPLKGVVQAQDALTVLIRLRAAFIAGLVKRLLWGLERRRLNGNTAQCYR